MGGHVNLLLSNDENLRMYLALAGYKTIHDLWLPKVAADQFLSVCDALLSSKPVPVFADGPMKLLGNRETFY